MENIRDILKKYVNKMEVEEETKEKMLKACESKKQVKNNKDNKIK